MTVIRRKLFRYPALAALVVAGAISIAPRTTHAYYGSVGACTAGAAATTLSKLQVHVEGGTNYALPVSTSAASTTTPSLTVSTSSSAQTLASQLIASLYTAFGITPTITLTSTAPMTGTSTAFAMPSAQDYGYLSYVNGLTAPYQGDGPNNATAALFTFAAGTSGVSDTTGGPILASAHVGTLTIYAVTGQSANFSVPSSFQAGTPILTATYTLINSGVPASSIVGMSSGQMNRTAYGQKGIGPDFLGSGLATITSTAPFSLDGACYQLGTVGSTIVMNNAGHLASPTSTNGAFWGAWGSPS